MTLTNIEQKLIKCFDRPSIRIRIPRLEMNKGKFPLIPNWPTVYEPWTIAQILANGHNWGIRTGKQIGSYHFIIIDLDNLWSQQIIKTSSFIQTSKGIHYYVLIKELPKSQHLFNKFGQKIGDLLSLGKQGIGIGSQHRSGIRYSFKQKRHNSPWFVKLENLLELESFLKVREIFTMKNKNFFIE